MKTKGDKLKEAYGRIIVAMDVPSLSAAVSLAEKLLGRVGCLKVGKELFTASGMEVVTELCGMGLPVFLDLKFHDIPQTVMGAARSAGRLGVAMFTVHSSGGAEMVAQAVKGAAEGAREGGQKPPLVLAVTVLTSIDQKIYNEIGFSGSLEEGVRRLAKLAKGAGAGGIVCSPNEIEIVRESVGERLKIVTPGVRPQGSEKGDQKRTMTPAEAIRKGADFLVIGRPITKAGDPQAAVEEIAEEIATALQT
ncbi:MAG: orotidine-5'-phosphate decarboxylase [Myxococcota bacterium]